MNPRRASRKPPPFAARSAEALPSPPGRLAALVAALVAALLVARLLVPAESAVKGETLWLVQLWLAAGLVWAWDAWRRRDFALHVGALDAALWLLIAGHLVSGAAVFFAGGERRAALNLMWEWIGLGVSFFLVRQVRKKNIAAAGRLAVVMTASVIVLAGLGLWQHYVALPELVAEYEAHPERFREQIERLGLADDAGARQLLELRLRSTEPFALFALANTLAGLLTAWGLVAAALVAAGVRSQVSWWVRAVALGGVVVVGFCLVLTKSRTAWLGLLVGAMAWGWFAVRQRRAAVRRRRLLIATGVAAIAGAVALFAAAAASGGFDRKVLSEAPKSLRYRLEYWQGSLSMLRERPMFGAGPGNFRQHYLAHKLPHSSEEIADPHNLLLDVWSSAGLIGVAGLLALLVAGWSALRGDFPIATRGDPQNEAEAAAAILIGGALGFVLVLLGGLLLADVPDMRVACLFAAWAPLAILLSRIPLDRYPSWLTAGVGAGIVALVVHLFGAGGIEMPAVVQTLLVLFAIGSTPASGESSAVDSRKAAARPPQVPSSGRFGSLAQPLISITLAVLCMLCWTSAVGPVLERQLALAAGDAALERGRFDIARERYASAGGSDPLSPEPFQRLARLELMRWQRSGGLDRQAFEDGLKWADLAVAADPHNPYARQLPADAWWERHRLSGDPEDAQQAARWFARAVADYPTSAFLHARLAQALSGSGDADDGRGHAETALKLDEIARQYGHSDKRLPPDLRMQIQKLLERPRSNSAPAN